MVSLKIYNLFSHVVRNSVADNRQPASPHLSPFTFHRSSHRRGFTLIELLIVTVVIVTLMGIVFRLAGVGGDSRKKSLTQSRLQRLENALSGYYAAYGSYPPVPLQNRSRDINVRVDGNGVQGKSSDTSSVSLSSPDNETKKQVEAACRAQPIAVHFPFFMNSRVNGKLMGKTQTMVNALAARTDGFSFMSNVGGLNIGRENEAELFQFGLLSFLLPRYLFMLGGAPEMYDTPHSQWAKNNQRPCRIDTGRQYESWESMQEYVYGEGSANAEQSFLVANLPSQAVCARWMPNFRDGKDGIISGGLEFYGVETSDGDRPFLLSQKYTALPDETGHDCLFLHMISKNGYNGKSDYLLNGMTVSDGWNHEFYYYSDTPYQSYRLWSAGPNGLTFPPWLMEHLDSYSPKEQETITGWTKDDISHLAN